MRRATVSLGLAFLVFCTAVSGHHAISAVYDSSKRVTIDGVVSQVQFINPHPFLLVDVKDSGGKTQPWRLEMDNRWELAQIGFEPETLKHGDRVVVSGSLGRVEPRSLYILRLDRPADGFSYEQVGSSPRISSRGKVTR